LLVASGMRAFVRRSMLRTLLLLGVSCLAPAAEGLASHGRCPGYVNHLRAARNYLARGQREAAAEQLRAAEKALEQCLHSESGETWIAGASRSVTGA
jgi:hypothetical protein